MFQAVQYFGNSLALSMDSTSSRQPKHAEQIVVSDGSDAM